MDDLDVWAVVPAKEFRLSKTRLSDVLHDRQRQYLCDAMLRDVLSTLSSCVGIAGILVVTRDAEAKKIANEFDAQIVDSPIEIGASAAISAAAKILASEGHSAMLAIMSDLPLITCKEISDLLTEHASSPAATLVPSRNGFGTNAALCSPPDLVPFRFDGRSLLHNQDISSRNGATVRVKNLDGLGLDIDTSGDLVLFLEQHSTTLTAEFLVTQRYTEHSHGDTPFIPIHEPSL